MGMIEWRNEKVGMVVVRIDEWMMNVWYLFDEIITMLLHKKRKIFYTIYGADYKQQTYQNLHMYQVFDATQRESDCWTWFSLLYCHSCV